MGELVGRLKVTVVQGKRLVIRDFKSSDPYVIVKLGNQVDSSSSKGGFPRALLCEYGEDSLLSLRMHSAGYFRCISGLHCYCLLVMLSQLQSLQITQLKASNQTVKTKVISSCLNPVWNEEFTFSVTEPIGVLNLEVFDRDRFKADDKMGQAHLNVQPIASAARLRRVLNVSAGETMIRKVVPASDNCLVRESSVNCVDGEIVQDVWLRLCGVESGEIELKIKWVDLPSVASQAPSSRV